MVNITINNQSIQAPIGTKLLEACNMAGVVVPTLCYMAKINEIGSCRVCLVEVEGMGLCAACNTPIQEGMVFHTDTPSVLAARRANLQAIMDKHRNACATCLRQETCALRDLASKFDLADNTSVAPEKGIWDESFPLQRDSSKCITCMRCVAECANVQHCNVWDFTGTGPNMHIIVRDGRSIRDSGCTLCGQCVTHCPTGALTARNDINRVLSAIADPDSIVVAQVAPAVRAAWGEDLGIPSAEATPGRMAAALKQLGFDYVFDTNFAADLTIMEEGNELLEWITEGKPRPMFTSCCPGWVRFAKLHYPQFANQLSSSKSPHQMMGAVIKNTLLTDKDNNKKRLFVVSIMPCIAKKYECDVPQLSTEAGSDVDAVLTVREFARLIRMTGIELSQLSEEAFDDPLGKSTGAATIFGRTGGVMEAALRTASYLLTGNNPALETCDTTDATPSKPWTTKEISVGGIDLRIAITSGLENTAALLDALIEGTEKLDFVEVMACPGGCAGGGGQPISFNKELASDRIAILNMLDENDTLRFSHDNPDIQSLYRETLITPLSPLAQEWLHTQQTSWDI